MKKIIASILLLSLVLSGCSKPSDPTKPIVDPVKDKDDNNATGISNEEVDALNKRTEFLGSSILFTEYPNREVFEYSKHKMTQFYFVGLVAAEEGKTKDLGQEYNYYSEVSGEDMRLLMKQLFNEELTPDYDTAFTSAYVEDEDVYRFPLGGIGGTGYPTPNLDEATYKKEKDEYIVEVPLTIFDGKSGEDVERGTMVVTYGKSKDGPLNFYYKTVVMNLKQE